MDRKAFHALLKRYLDGKCTAEERGIVDEWYELLDDSEVQVPEDGEEFKAIEKRLWRKIQNEAISVKKPNTQANNVWFLHSAKKWWVAAACMLLAIGGYLFFSPGKTASIESEKVQQGLTEISNFSSLPKNVLLEDGSKITLQTGGKIAFPKHFLPGKREVYLEGEAFFEVSKNPSRPFFVYNNNLVTEVLGTSFNIKIVNGKIEVDVRTGRVAVYENGSRIKLSAKEKLENGVIITPNQKVTYYTENRHFITSIVDVPLPVPAKEKQDSAIKFVYDDTPLYQVLSSVEKVYGIEIVLENENLKNCPFTGDITKPSLFNKLQFICQVFGASYEIKGTSILIKGGKSCN
jgi:ferric-dicitrate binding protein FerR (iron transport regulator)